jgi:hypothetical protein
LERSDDSNSLYQLDPCRVFFQSREFNPEIRLHTKAVTFFMSDPACDTIPANSESHVHPTNKMGDFVLQEEIQSLQDITSYQIQNELDIDNYQGDLESK